MRVAGLGCVVDMPLVDEVFALDLCLHTGKLLMVEGLVVSTQHPA